MEVSCSLVELGGAKERGFEVEREAENVKSEIGPNSGVETSSGSCDMMCVLGSLRNEVGFGFLGRRAAS